MLSEENLADAVPFFQFISKLPVRVLLKSHFVPHFLFRWDKFLLPLTSTFMVPLIMAMKLHNEKRSYNQSYLRNRAFHCFLTTSLSTAHTAAPRANGLGLLKFDRPVTACGFFQWNFGKVYTPYRGRFPIISGRTCPEQQALDFPLRFKRCRLVGYSNSPKLVC